MLRLRTLYRNVIAALQEHNYYGLNIDFEYIFPFDRESYNQFLRRIVDTLHPLGYIVTTAVAPKISDEQMGLLYTAHDYRAHGETVDQVIIMTYEWGLYLWSGHGGSADRSGEKSAGLCGNGHSAGKILMGMPNMATTGLCPLFRSAASVLSNTGAAALASNVGRR